MAANEEPINTQQATPLLRQLSEPHAEAFASEPNGQDEAVPSMRRLTSNYLVELVRNANSSWAVTKPVGEACEREARTLCANEMRLMQMAFYDANNRWNSPYVEEGLRNMYLCFAANSEALSPLCMDAMVEVFLNAARSGQPSPTAQWQPQPTGAAVDQSDGTNEKRRGNHKMRHHKHEQDDDSSDDSRPISQGLGIYVVNNNGGEAAAKGYAIGPWGKHDRHERHHHHHGTHPLVWMVVLPFFCVGVFVSVKHAVAYIKKRNGGSLPFATQGHAYEPLKVPDSPTE